jgi:hypothetical protein
LEFETLTGKILQRPRKDLEGEVCPSVGAQRQKRVDRASAKPEKFLKLFEVI